VPSMRRIRTIPGFTPDPAWGYGYDEKTKEMLGGLTWGDVHHPALSETNGEYDGRWLFVNDNANNRVARINLKTFFTEQILGPVPNIMGPHSRSEERRVGKEGRSRGGPARPQENRRRCQRS